MAKSRVARDARYSRSEKGKDRHARYRAAHREKVAEWHARYMAVPMNRLKKAMRQTIRVARRRVAACDQHFREILHGEVL